MIKEESMKKFIKNGYVSVIGAANLDINGFSCDPVNMEDSNPGRVEYCPGGVGRNIAENLRRLGTDVHLISVIGDDPGGTLIRSSCRNIVLDIEHSLFLPNTVSSVYLALMDSNGEMKLALSDLSCLEKLSEQHLENEAALIEHSSIIVLDTNLSEEIIRFILKRFSPDSGNSPKGPLFFLYPVSARKSAKVKSCIGSFDTVKLNRMEAEFLSGIPIPPPPPDIHENPEAHKVLLSALKEAGSYFIKQGAGVPFRGTPGVRRVFITLGKGGVYYHDADKNFFTPVRYVQPVNTSGGGDAFMAGMVYGTLQDWEGEAIVSFSAAMAAITVQSQTTVCENISLELVRDIISKEEQT
jgi:pseudouridine kinase